MKKRRRGTWRQVDTELHFAFETNCLPTPSKQALLVDMDRYLRKPPPDRIWWIVDPAGGKHRLED